MTLDSYIDLDRQFILRETNKDVEEMAVESLSAHGSYYGVGSFGWDALLSSESGITVILGEPGSGRTFEFEQQCRYGDAPFSFYLPLTHLAKSGDATWLGLERDGEFSDWKESSEVACFFLDAVDEAKLESVAAFEFALRNFVALVGDFRLKRAKIFISCRVHQWDPKSDESRVLSIFTQEDGKRQLPVYRILPLDRERVKCYAKEKHSLDAEAFIKAIEDNHLWGFAGRPYDVDFLLTYWEAEGRLDSLDQMISGYVDSQLVERRGDSARSFPVDRGKLRNGAETLAAATIFCNQLDFQDFAANGSASKYLLVSQCLTQDWSQKEMAALLDRPLFTTSQYGKIRFQHRRSSEFLAAKWVEARKDEISNKDIENLFFAEVRGQLRLRASREPVAVWLSCISDESWALELRSKVISVSPESFFKHGDPMLLPSLDKCEIIQRYIEKFSDFDTVRSEFEDQVLARFSDQLLSEKTAALLMDTSVLPGVKIDLLRIAESLSFENCVDAAIALVFGDTNRLDLPSYAMRLVSKCATEQQKKSLAGSCVDLIEPRPAVVGELIQLLYPEFISVDEVKRLIAAPGERGDRYLIAWELSKKVEKLEQFDGVLELSQVLLSIQEETRTGRESRSFRKSCWLGSPLQSCFEKLMAFDCLNVEATETAGQLLWWLQRREFKPRNFRTRGEEVVPPDMDVLSLQHPKVRQSSFWLEIEDQKEKKANSAEHRMDGLFEFTHYLSLNPSDEDLVWLESDLKTRDENSDRDIAFRFLICLAWSKEFSSQIFSHVLASNGLTKKEKSEVRSVLRLRRTRWLRGWRWKLRNRIYSLRWKAFAVKDWWQSHLSSFRNRIWFLRNQNSLRSGKSAYQLSWLCRYANESTSRRVPGDLSQLELFYGVRMKYFGRKLRLAVEEGCIATWTQYAPDINKETHGVIPGATAISILWARGDIKFEELSKGMAERAVRYAFCEMNGFPPWFDSLVLSQPGVAESVVIEALLEEWFSRKTNGRPIYLTRLNEPGSALAPIVTKFLARMMRLRDPENLYVLQTIQEILERQGCLSHCDWAEIAKQRVRLYDVDHEFFEAWLVIWIQTDAESAFAFLGDLDSLRPYLDQHEHFMVNIASCFSGHDRCAPRIASPSHMKVENVESWVRLLFEWVNPGNDMLRIAGEGFSPTDRDNAERYRGNLLSKVSELPDLEIDEILDRLIADFLFTSERNFLHYLRTARLQARADQESWTENQFRDFADTQEVSPRTLNELFRLSLRRFESIKHDVERAEESIRGHFQVADNEAGLQSFLVQRLRQISAGKYTVPKETEIDKGNRPDFQIHNPVASGSVQIEVKFADLKGRSAASLRNDLENQLLKKYLRDDYSLYGVFVIGSADITGRWQHPETKKMLRFSELIDWLQLEATRLEELSGSVKGLRVVGINFSR